MTVAEEAAAELRERARRGRPFRLAAFVASTVAIGARAGVVVGTVLFLMTPLMLSAVMAADRYRINRNLREGVLARAYASLPGSPLRGSRWIGMLSVESDGVRWIASRRFRERGAKDVFLPWEHINDVSAARVSPAWLGWMARNDVLAFDWAGGRLAFAVTSPQAIYQALRGSGHAPPR